MHEAGLFDDVGWLAYCAAQDSALAAFRARLLRAAAGRRLSVCTRATAVLYVGVDEALRRIRARGRRCEIDGVARETLAAIHEAHRRAFASALWLNTERATLESAPLLPPACAGVPA